MNENCFDGLPLNNINHLRMTTTLVLKNNFPIPNLSG